jgi:hypothetical protein
VRRAVNAFKKKRNMKKVKKKKKKMESVVDQIIRKRKEEDDKPKPIPRPPPARAPLVTAKATTARRNSLGTDSTASSTLSSNNRRQFSPDGRPESVAARVQRERTAKRIKAKTPVTKKVMKPPSAMRRESASAAAKDSAIGSGKMADRMRQSAASHSHTSKWHTKQMIKQQV